MRSLQTILNEANLNRLTPALADARLGTLLTLVPKCYSGAVTANAIALPENAKAVCVLAAFVTAIGGGGSAGAKTPVPGAPAAGQVGLSPTGDIVFAAADLATAAQVVYLTQEGEVIEETISVAANVGTFLNARASGLILACTATIGGAVGAKTVAARNTVPAAGNCSLSLDGLGVTFAAADAVTQCTVRYVVFPAAGVGTALKVANKNY